MYSLHKCSFQAFGLYPFSFGYSSNRFDLESLNFVDIASVIIINVSIFFYKSNK